MGSSSLQFPSLDAAIAEFEGFGKSGTLATRNNNPGNLVYGPFAKSQGATGSEKGFATFPDVATGTEAMDNLLGNYASKGYNLKDTIDAWNGHGSNSDQYTDFVASKTGIKPLDTFNDWLGTGVADMLKQDVSDMDAIRSGASTLFSLTNLSYTRIAAFLLGLIFIIAGLMMFKPTHDVIVNTTEKVKNVATTAAVVAA